MHAKALGGKRLEFTATRTRACVESSNRDAWRRGIRRNTGDLRISRSHARRSNAWGMARRVEEARRLQRLRNGLDLHVTRRRQPANLFAYVGPRKPRREQLLDLPPRLAAACLEQLRRVRIVQERCKRAQRTQVQLAASNALECFGESSTHTRRRYSPASAAFAHAQSFDAIGKQGRKTEFQMQRAQLELHQVRKHPCTQRIALPNQLRQPSQEF